MTLNSQPPRVQSTFRGASQADVLPQAATDAERAKANDYVPVQQDWTEDGTQMVLTVTYELRTPATAQMNGATASRGPVGWLRQLKNKKWPISISTLILIGALYSIGHRNTTTTFDAAYVDAYIHAAPYESFRVTNHADGGATLRITVPEKQDPKRTHECSFDVDASGNTAPGYRVNCD